MLARLAWATSSSARAWASLASDSSTAACFCSASASISGTLRTASAWPPATRVPMSTFHFCTYPETLA